MKLSLSQGGATPTQRSGMLNTIVTQCLGALALTTFTNGILLVYLKALGVSDARIAGYLSIQSIAVAVLVIPAAYVADRHGKKRVGLAGVLLSALGFIVLALAGFLSSATVEPVSVIGIAFYSVGYTLQVSSWFALLSPIVPDTFRGRFFGVLRFSWQLTGVLFAGACAMFLSHDSPLSTHQGVLGLIAVAMVIRIRYYLKIPEMEATKDRQTSPAAAIVRVLQSHRFMAFCSYVLLLFLFTHGAPVLFGLIEKQVMKLGDNTVVALGGVLMAGSVTGFFIGGFAVDRLGPKPVFMFSHFGYAAVLLLFVGRGFFAPALSAFIGLLHFGFGFVLATSSVAISAQMLALIPSEGKSMFTSMHLAFLRWGSSLSGLLIAGSLKVGLFSETWKVGKHTMSSFDAILLLYGAMVFVLVATLTLIPSVGTGGTADGRRGP